MLLSLPPWTNATEAIARIYDTKQSFEYDEIIHLFIIVIIIHVVLFEIVGAVMVFDKVKV